MNPEFVKKCNEHIASTISCKYCGKPTRSLGTQLCDICWELELHISMNPVLATRILAHVVEQEKKRLEWLLWFYDRIVFPRSIDKELKE